MAYAIIPLAHPRVSRRSMAYLGASPLGIFQIFGRNLPQPIVDQILRRRGPSPVAPLPVPPAERITAQPPPAVASAGPPSGYCVFTSSPETGSITSVEACSAAPGGTPIATPTVTPSVASPVPSTQPTNQPYTDSVGNIWTYGASGWQVTGNVSSALTSGGGGSAAAAPSVTVSQPTVSPYQSVLDWLSQETLVTGVPNWGIVAAAAVGLVLLKNRNGGRR